MPQPTQTKVVRLTPCTDLEYAEFVPQQISEYARQLAEAREVPRHKSVDAARARLADLVDDRLRSDGHDFFVAVCASSANQVGWLWLSPALIETSARHARWVSQLTVLEPSRRQGWGRAILSALEEHELDRGTQEIWLRVFDWNVAARHLYLSHGYELVQQFATDAHLRTRLRAPVA